MEQLLQKMFEHYLKNCEELEPEEALKETMEYFEDELDEFTSSIHKDGYDDGFSDALGRMQDALDRI